MTCPKRIDSYPSFLNSSGEKHRIQTSPAWCIQRKSSQDINLLQCLPPLTGWVQAKRPFGWSFFPCSHSKRRVVQRDDATTIYCWRTTSVTATRNQIDYLSINTSRRARKLFLLKLQRTYDYLYWYHSLPSEVYLWSTVLNTVYSYFVYSYLIFFSLRLRLSCVVFCASLCLLCLCVRVVGSLPGSTAGSSNKIGCILFFIFYPPPPLHESIINGQTITTSMNITSILPLVLSAI